MVRKVGIVGSSESHWTSKLKMKAVQDIRKLLTFEAIKETEKILANTIESDEYRKTLFYSDALQFSTIILVSGASPKKGVDEFAEIAADSLGVKKEIYPADVNQWDDWDRYEGSGRITKRIGYKTRNIQIAKAIDVLYCIDPVTRKPDEGGGMWTLRYAKRLNKETHHVIIR